MQAEKNVPEKYQLSIEKVIAKPVAEVFRALGEGRLFLNCSAGMETMKVDFKVGGKYRIDFVSFGMCNHGEFLEIIPDRKIVFTWCQDAQASSTPDTTVTIQLREQGAQTHLTLTHEGFRTPKSVDDHRGGWTGGLDDLSAEITVGKLRFNRFFKVPVAKLYEKCKDPATFFGMMGDVKKGKVDFKVGGRYQVPTEKGEIRGQFLEIVPGQIIVFTWESSPCGERLTQDTKVTLGFEVEDDSESWLELIHEGLDTESLQKTHRQGWDSVITRLMG